MAIEVAVWVIVVPHEDNINDIPELLVAEWHAYYYMWDNFIVSKVLFKKWYEYSINSRIQSGKYEFSANNPIIFN